MYVPPSFRETDPVVMHDFIAAHPFGALITSSASAGLFATHMPWLLDRSRGTHGVVQGHIARANPHHGFSSEGPEALVLFTGPDAYVTPSWYPTKALHGKVVPTWNYVAVHAYGRLRFIDDRDFMMHHLDLLTERHEGDRAHPWAMHDAPQEFLDQLAKAVVGVELEITRLEAQPANRNTFTRSLVCWREMHNIAVAFTRLRERCGIKTPEHARVEQPRRAAAFVARSPAVQHLSWRVDPATRTRPDRCRRLS